MFTIVYTPVNGGSPITATNIHSIAIAPQHDRTKPQMLRLNGGVGGGGISGAGAAEVPIANVVSITVAEI